MEPILRNGKVLRVSHSLSMLNWRTNLDGRVTERCFADTRRWVNLRSPKMIRRKWTCGFPFSQRLLDIIFPRWPYSGGFHFPRKPSISFRLLFQSAFYQMTKLQDSLQIELKQFFGCFHVLLEKGAIWSRHDFVTLMIVCCVSELVLPEA